MVSYSPDSSGSSYTPPSGDQATFEAEKRAIYKHPLFPLLALVFERCEQASNCFEPPEYDGFNSDIQAFIQHQQKDKKPFLTDDAEVDGLMIKAIQVLRIHLLELEKVQELCKDFCSRYISCLKSKMQSENLLKPDYSKTFSENSFSDHSNDSRSPILYSPHSFQTVGGGGSSIISNDSSTFFKENSATLNSFLPKKIEIPATLSVTMVDGAGGLGSRTSSEIAASDVPYAPNELIGQNEDSMPAHGSLSPTSLTTSCDEGDDHLTHRRKQKRGVLPKYATSIMRAWLFQHLVHPYPTEDEKKQIASQTHLTLLQVNNWFINARRRILQPMLDASSTDQKAIDLNRVSFKVEDDSDESDDESANVGVKYSDDDSVD